MEKTLVNTIIISLLLAIATFTIGYYLYSESSPSQGLLRLGSERAARIGSIGHSASNPIPPGTIVVFEVVGSENATVLIHLDQARSVFQVTQQKPGMYTGTFTIPEMESAVIDVFVELRNETASVEARGPSITVDATPPEIMNISSTPLASEGSAVMLVITTEPNATVSAELQMLGTIQLAEEQPGTYTGVYAVRRGDDRNGLIALVTLTDAVGNSVTVTRPLSTIITTNGPRIESFSMSDDLLKYGEKTRFVFEGEEGADVQLKVSQDVVILEETALGTYKGEYSFEQANTEKALSLLLRVSKDDRLTTRAVGTLSVDSVPPAVKSFVLTTAKPLKTGEVLKVMLSSEEGGQAFFKAGDTIPLTEMLEVEPGIYQGVYSVAYENADAVQVIAFFKDKAGNQVGNIPANIPLTIDTIPPVIKSVSHDARKPLGLGKAMNVTVVSEPNLTVWFELGSTSEKVQMQEVEAGVYKGSWAPSTEGNISTTYIMAAARDAAGNDGLPQLNPDPVSILTVQPKIESVTHNGQRMLSVGDVIDVKLEGPANGRAWFVLLDLETNKTSEDVFLYEDEPGRYLGRYQIGENEVFERAAVIGYFEDEAGNPAKPFVVQQKLEDTPFQLTTLLGVTVMILIVPIFLYFYRRYKGTKEFEEAFPDFLSDLHSIMGSQLPLPQALNIIRHSDYGKLSKLINTMYNRLVLGVPFDRAFRILGKETSSPSIKSAIEVLVNAYKVGGGRLSEVFAATAFNFRQIRNLKKERLSEMQIHVVSGYIIFILFLGILIILNNTLFTASLTASSAGTQNVTLSTGEVIEILQGQAATGSKYTDVLFYLFFIQAFFSGISIGELAEGNFMAGLKHAVVLMTIALIAATFLA
ncbi:MAG: type II secretion system F family protein [Candidatus Diapherotrites archaeon]|nr:type II secretion system F family protein [Candidatus Diapherotrites archaeon]